MHLIRLSTDGTELVCEGLFSHPNEIWDLASCPFDQRIFSTVYSTGNWWFSISSLYIKLLIFSIYVPPQPEWCLKWPTLSTICAIQLVYWVFCSLYCFLAFISLQFTVSNIANGLIKLDILEGESYGAAIWQIPELYGELNSPQLERIASLDAHVGKIKWWVWISWSFSWTMEFPNCVYKCHSFLFFPFFKYDNCLIWPFSL